jgi:hypothetical protein
MVAGRRKKLEQRLDKKGKAKAKVEAELTDVVDRTAIDEIKVKVKD